MLIKNANEYSCNWPKGLSEKQIKEKFEIFDTGDTIETENTRPNETCSVLSAISQQNFQVKAAILQSSVPVGSSSD